MSKNRENPGPSIGYSGRDPLGIKALDVAVAALRDEAACRDAVPNETWRSLVSHLEASHRALALKMDLLRDRYGVLKQTSAQLANEVAWLRDQLDDLASVETPPKPGNAAKTERRYTDRWKGRRP